MKTYKIQFKYIVWKLSLECLKINPGNVPRLSKWLSNNKKTFLIKL